MKEIWLLSLYENVNGGREEVRYSIKSTVLEKVTDLGLH